MTFHHLIAPKYISSSVRVTVQPHAEVQYEVHAGRVEVTCIGTGPLVWPHIVRPFDLVNEIQAAAENNWRSQKAMPDEAETNYKQENNW